MSFGNIEIVGARQHNLKNVNLTLPRRNVIVMTGVSGSGKSSLAFDTIYAEGQRRYIESLSTYARQFIEKLERPDIDSISGISPTIAIQHRNTVTSARSTVGTATEIFDYLRLLFARVGKTICPACGVQVKAHSPSNVAAEVVKRFRGKRVFLVQPAGVVDRDGWKTLKAYLVSRGYSRLLADTGPVRIEEYEVRGRGERKILVLIDRLAARSENRTRIAEAVELAYRESSGSILVLDASGDERYTFTHTLACDSCGMAFADPAPLFFSFNSPYGACPDCRGFGSRMEFSEDLIVPDRSRSLSGRAIDPWSRERFSYFHYRMLEHCERNGIPVDVPYRDLAEDMRMVLLEGDENYIGVLKFLEKLKQKSYKKGNRFYTRKYMAFTTCRACGGGRLRSEANHVKFGGLSISEVARMTPPEIIAVLSGTPLSKRDRSIARDILAELHSRLGFMIDVGLGYLTLDRLTRTLSGGEAQRINLATSLGANLVDTLYVLDEPSIGLHAADNEKLIAVLNRLRDLGNTVLIVEHDPVIIRSADFIVDLGPGAGVDGGEILFSGTTDEAKRARVARSRTLPWVFQGKRNGTPGRKRRSPDGHVFLGGVSEHNLRGIDVRVPMGCLVCVTGVSGSGKSTLVVDVLHSVLKNRSAPGNVKVKSVRVEGRIDRVLLVDQGPIGATPRSNPITYIKGFSYIRESFARQKLSLVRGYLPGRFSFNKRGGRCSRCQGMGYRRVEMHFMADVFVPCEECGGSRFNGETLDVLYRGKNISEVLEMTVDEAMIFFDEVPQLGEKLWMLSRVGLGYLKLGQPSNTLSGGESQRLKIARELAESKGERNFYIMDEPTTGLHVSDIGVLLKVLDGLVDGGHTVLVIEHNMDVISAADHIIDLGPGGGDEGGAIIACGPPDRIVQSRKSKTGEYLKQYLARYRGSGP